MYPLLCVKRAFGTAIPVLANSGIQILFAYNPSAFASFRTS